MPTYFVFASSGGCSEQWGPFRSHAEAEREVIRVNGARRRHGMQPVTARIVTAQPMINC